MHFFIICRENFKIYKIKKNDKPNATGTQSVSNVLIFTGCWKNRNGLISNSYKQMMISAVNITVRFNKSRYLIRRIAGPLLG